MPAAVANVATADGTANFTVAVPAGTANGDLLVGVVASDWSTLALNTLPLASWTALTTSDYDGGSNNMHIGLFARVASSEPANYTVTVGGGADSVAAILRVTGWDTASGIAGAIVQVAPVTFAAGTTAASAPSLTPSGADDLLLTFHSADGANGGGTLTWTPPSGMTEQADRQSTTFTSLEVASLQSPSSPSGTKTATSSPTNHGKGASCTISIKSVSGGITGTVAETQDANAASASGVLGYAGTVAATQANQTSTASGTNTPPGFSGTVAVTQANQTAAAAGNLGYTGTLSRTQAANTASASGTVTSSGFVGSVAATQASQTSTASGVLGYSGTVNATQAGNTAAASGKLGYTGTLSRTQANQIAATSGLVAIPIAGTVAVIQANQIATATGINQPLVTFGTSSAGVGITPSSHPNKGLAPFSKPATLATASTSAAAGGAPSSTSATSRTASASAASGGAPTSTGA